jgi:hypothetical protein
VVRLGPGVAPQPLSTITGDLGASNEGRLLSVRATITQRQWPALYIDDGSGEARVRVLDSTGIPALSGGAGDSVFVTGVLGQWDGRYMLLPRYASDISITERQPDGADDGSGTSNDAGDEADTPDEPDAQYMDIALADVRALPLGTRVRFEARVTAPPGVLGEARAYVGDEVAGIALHLTGDGGGYPSLLEGDRVEVRGELDAYHGERVVRLAASSDVVWLESGAPVEPVHVQTGSVAAGTEGRLVSVRAPIARRQWPTLYLDDGSGEASVRVMDTPGISAQQGATGDMAVVTGVVGQWDGRWRLLPRWPQDLEIAVIATVPRSGAGGTGPGTAGSTPALKRQAKQNAPNLFPLGLSRWAERLILAGRIGAARGRHGAQTRPRERRSL